MQQPIRLHGPGTELTALIQELGLESLKCESCGGMAAKMNRLGPAGCREHREEIVLHLRQSADKLDWWTKAKTALAIVSEPWWNPLDNIGCLVDEAIRRAEAKTVGGAQRLAMIGPPALAPLWRHRFSNDELLLADHCLNPSIIIHVGRTYLAYRRGWVKARIVLAELDSKHRILWQKQLDLPLRDRANLAHEDPRLFTFAGSLHVAYTGCQRYDRLIVASVCYARLSDSGDVLADYQPIYAGAQEQEKNWGFFDHGGNLYAVYWTSGQRRILRIDGERAELAHDYRQNPPYVGGEPRGGASPVLHNGEWYSFFHGVTSEGVERIYTAGLYTFDTEPPFRIRRFIRQPLLLPNLAERPQESLPHCVYPAGVVLRGGEWIVSVGVYDHYCDLAAFSASALDSLLEAAV